jgi:hypothetical protein
MRWLRQNPFPCPFIFCGYFFSLYAAFALFPVRLAFDLFCETDALTLL